MWGGWKTLCAICLKGWAAFMGQLYFSSGTVKRQFSFLFQSDLYCCPRQRGRQCRDFALICGLDGDTFCETIGHPGERLAVMTSFYD